MGGGQGGCDRRIEVFGKIQKKNWEGGVWGGFGSGGVGLVGWGVRVDVRGFGFGGGLGGCERRIKVFVKIQKNIFFLGGVGVGGGGEVGGSGWM